jgi:hypothetical protein
MAEMTTLVSAVYRKYSTSIKSDFRDVAPGVTSRFEVFHDDTLEKVSVSTCLNYDLAIDLTSVLGTRVLDRLSRAMISVFYVALLNTLPDQFCLVEQTERNMQYTRRLLDPCYLLRSTTCHRCCT